MPTATQAKNAEQTVRNLVESQIEEEKQQSKSEKADQSPNSRKYNATTDDFFDYISRTVTPNEWETGGTCLYIYKQAQTGNEQLERLFRPITLDEFRDTFLPKYGPGNYLLHFQTRLKQLSTCSKRLSFDAKGGVLGEPAGSVLGAPAYMPGLASAISATSEMLKDGAKAAVEVSKVNQLDNNKGMDVGGLIAGIAALIPKNDNSFLITMLENQRQEAERRAERETKDAKDRLERWEKEQERRDKDAKEAQARELKAIEDRSNRDQQFFQQMQAQSDKFWTAMLAEKDKKTVGVETILQKALEMFVDRAEGGGDEPPAKNMIGLLDKLAPAIVQLAGPIAAKITGAPMPPMQPTQPQLNPAQPAAEPVNGEHKFAAPTVEELSALYCHSIVVYLHTHDVPDQETVEHFAESAFREYQPVYALIQQFPKEQIVERLKQDKVGQLIFTAPNGPLFLEALIEEIKRGDEELPPEVEEVKQSSRKQKVKPV